jgi:hypothetical protein
MGKIPSSEALLLKAKHLIGAKESKKFTSPFPAVEEVSDAE